MIVNLKGVKLDGSTPVAPQCPAVQAMQAVRWPMGFAGTLHVDIVNEAHAAEVMDGKKVRLTIRRDVADAQALVCLDSALGSSDIAITETGIAAAKAAAYRYDLVLIDDSDIRWLVLANSPWLFEASVSQATDDAPFP